MKVVVYRLSDKGVLRFWPTTKTVQSQGPEHIATKLEGRFAAAEIAIQRRNEREKRPEGEFPV